MLFEIYNCGDVNTYADLARLAGARYLTLPETDVRRLPPGVPVAEQDRANPTEDAFVAQVAEAVRRVRADPASPFRKPASRPARSGTVDHRQRSGSKQHSFPHQQRLTQPVMPSVGG